MQSDFCDTVSETLEAAGIPVAQFAENDEGDAVCSSSGWHIADCGRRFTTLAIIGRSSIEDVVRQGERDELTQKVRAALRGAGIEVRVNEYGNLTAVNR